jgi:4-aminobutyrate aminotransferase/(S)-3-amino-2-methylpropionate transaminase
MPHPDQRHRLVTTIAGPKSVVGDVRGGGPMLAPEFARPHTKDPGPDVAHAVAAHCHAEGVLALVCGTYGNVIRLLPPLVIGHVLLVDAREVAS